MKRAAWTGLVLFLCAASLLWAQSVTPETYSQLKFRYIGPVGNRADSVAGVPGDPNIWYVGAASGGIFKSTDGGIHWDPIFDSQPASSIGALAVAATDANIIWAGTGESFIRSHISIGNGVYKSTDAGKTWTHMGLEKTGRIARVEIDPHNPDNVVVCSLGTAYGPQQERGVYRTTDAGKNWTRTLFVDENTGCSDLGVDPNNFRIQYAGMWQIEIHTYGRVSGGPGSALYKSTDGGVTWKKLEGHGLPHPPIGRIAVRVAQKDSHRVYALIETGDGVPFEGKPTQLGSLWRSDDGGDSWQMVNADRQIRGRTAYYTRMEIAPDNENEVHFFSAAYSRTEDGGQSLLQIGFGGMPGGDNHEAWIDPGNGDRMAVVNDGGVAITVNRGKTWDRIQLPIAQVYHVTTDDQIPYFVYGNRQDGPDYRGPSNSIGGGFFGSGISRGMWHSLTGGESGFAVPDPVDNNIIWTSGTGSGSVGGAMFRFDERTKQSRAVEVWPENVSGDTAAEVKYRFNWEFPVTISPHDHNKVYVGSQFVHMTTDGGNSWQVISPDLTRNDKSKMGSSGGLTPDNIGVEYAGVVFAIAESSKEAGVLWAGTNDGLVQVTRDGGKNWTNVTRNIPNLPEWGTVSNIEASRFDAGTAYISVDFHQMDNRDPFIYKTTDYGKTWTQITNGIAHSMLSYVHCVREDPVRKGLLYAGTENGLYVSFNDGKDWQALQNNLPHAPVYWITVQERFHDLVLATYGRGFWILDDITPLQQATPEVLSHEAHLFPPRDTYRFHAVENPAAVSYDPTAGQNPPYGAPLDFYLKSKPGEKDKVHIVISDASGGVVRDINCNPQRGEHGEEQSEEEAFFRGPAARCSAAAGFNRFWWDLRSEPSAQIKLRTMPMYGVEVPLGKDGARNAPGGGRISILEPPGTYTVKLTVNGETSTQSLKVLKDPHSSGTETDIAAQTKLVTQLRDTLNAIADSVAQIESMKVQFASLRKEVGTQEVAAPVRDAAEKMTGQLTDLEGKVLQLKLSGRGQDDVRWAPMLADKINYLADVVASSDFPPTTQDVEVADQLTKQEQAFENDLDLFNSKDVVAFNGLLRERNAQYIIVQQKKTQRSNAAAK